ncbi:Uncharacterised protein [Mycobacteroides abscessus subsp. bolletii]|uniref:CDGP domain-containing protein n=1 Tax=Mycobacteroides abscessus TaxID=36809 RepID=UPI00092A880A|nr:hypothetical protein [Mycobacteroides abscessus]SIJ61703.1 Uncharacterised protein [Mycobacteroides abscessus subsp. bolletii]
MKIAATVAGMALAAGLAVVAAPAASAVPGDPMPGCETQVFATYCDGPIRPDGSWKRCLFASGQSGGPGVYVPPVQNCFMVPAADQIPPTPLGQPGHHID